MSRKKTTRKKAAQHRKKVEPPKNTSAAALVNRLLDPATWEPVIEDIKDTIGGVDAAYDLIDTDEVTRLITERIAMIVRGTA